MRAIFVTILCRLLAAFVRAEDERIWFDATLNSHPAHLIFDTGAPACYTLFRNAADRLGIEVTNLNDPEDTNKGYTGYTPECSLEINGETTKVWFWVLDLPSPLTNNFSADGLIGWPSVTNYVIKIDAKARMMLPFWHVPHDTSGWLKLPLQTGAPNFRLVIPKSNGRESVLVIDTGASEGIALRPDLWHEWKSSHTNQPTTLRADYMFGSGLTVHEEGWAKEIAFGSLTLTNIPITEAT